MQTLEKTKPIGQDWPQYAELQAVAAELAVLRMAGDFPIALAMLEARRDALYQSLEDEILERKGRYEYGNIQRVEASKDVPTIAEYERLIEEATADLERLDARIAAMDAYDLFQAQWTGELQASGNLRERIKGLTRAIENHPSKSFKLTEIPEFISIEQFKGV